VISLKTNSHARYRRNKASNLLIGAAVILLAALLVMSLLAGRQGYQNLLLVTPSAFGVPGHSPEKLEEFSEDEFLLTYEIRQTSTAQAIHSKHPVTLVGTNQNYANIMGYASLDGSFFTKAAWDAKNRHAVLGETAAFQIFGSSRVSGQTLKLNGESWIITGVIQDNDTENANIYVPSSVTGGQAESLMVLMDDKDITEAYAINALKSVGIHENNYDFINLSKSASAFSQRFSVALKAALSAAILLFVFNAYGRLVQSLHFYRKRMREIYFRELFVYHRADFVRTLAGLLFLAAGIALILLLFLGILETCLTWQEIIPVTGELTAGDFGGRLAWLRDYQWIGAALFAACTGVIVLSVFLAVGRKLREPKSPAEIRKMETLYGKTELVRHR